MSSTCLTITVPHLFLLISAFSAESKSYNISLHCVSIVNGSFQINQSDFSVSNKLLI